MLYKKRVPMRLKHHDYKSTGKYFITINTKNKGNILGRIENNNMILNKLGEIVKETWKEIGQYNFNIKLDEYVIMPDHIHGIIEINEYGEKDLSNIIGIFKSYSSRKINEACRGGSLTLPKKINEFHWQRSFYDEIIMNNVKYEKIKEYIRKNIKQQNKNKKDHINMV